MSFQDPHPLPALYMGLPSPTAVNETLSEQRMTRATTRSCRKALKQYSPSLNSTLFGYQHRSLARMLRQELQTLTMSDSPDEKVCQQSQPAHPSPLWIPVPSIAPNSLPAIFHLDPVRLVVRRSPPTYLPPPGGILSEDMGTGKTVILISLIVSTMDHLSRPPRKPNSGHEQEALTSWSQDITASGAFPSLVDIACHRIRTTRPPFDWRRMASSLPPGIKQKLGETSFLPFYLESIEPESRRLTRTQHVDCGAKKSMRIFLTNATLLLLPKMLTLQWRTELTKHLKPEVLRVLFVQKETSIPNARDLATQYDVSLQSSVDKFAP